MLSCSNPLVLLVSSSQEKTRKPAWLGADLALTPHLYNVLVYAFFGSPVVLTCFCVGSVPWHRYSSLPGRCISQVLLAGCHTPHFCFFFYFFLCVLGRALFPAGG